MSLSVKADIMPLIQGITESMVPYAKAQDILLNFKGRGAKLEIKYYPDLYIKGNYSGR